MNQKILDKLTRARTAMILDQPFFGSLALRLTLVETPQVSTLAVDGKRIFYNPDFIDSLSPSLVKSAMAHEVGHCIFDHIGRRGTRDPKRWNKAGDYVINPTIRDAGFELGQGWLYDPKFAGMSADHIYSLLTDDPADKSEGLCHIGGVSGAPGQDDENENEGEGEGEPLTAAEQREWKVAVIQAANAAKAMGKMPGSLERFIEGLTKPQVDWRAVLRRFVTQRSNTDYAWNRPNRRMLAHDIYLPGLFSETMGEIVVAVDTSGSIDNHTLKIFGSELAGIIADTRPAKVHVVYCDCRINKTAEFTPEDQFKLEACGGGGTEFKPVANWIEKNNLRPACVVYLTDLEGPTDFKEPEYPWLWCTIGSQNAKWGEILPIKV